MLFWLWVNIGFQSCSKGTKVTQGVVHTLHPSPGPAPEQVKSRNMQYDKLRWQSLFSFIPQPSPLRHCSRNKTDIYFISRCRQWCQWTFTQSNHLSWCSNPVSWSRNTSISNLPQWQASPWRWVHPSHQLPGLKPDFHLRFWLASEAVYNEVNQKTELKSALEVELERLACFCLLGFCLRLWQMVFTCNHSCMNCFRLQLQFCCN